MKDLHILILEDVPTDAELTKRELRKGGLAFSSKRVDTKEAFLKELKDFMPDIILADYKLPSFDGLSALEIAKEQCPDVPFIFVSGTIGEELAIETIKRGATDYVLKDRLSRLVSAVNRALHEAGERTDRKKAEQKAAHLNRLYTVLYEINEAIVRIHDRKELLEGACRIVVEHGLFRMAWVGLVDKNTRSVKPFAHWGFGKGYLDEIQGTSGEVRGGLGPTNTAIRKRRYDVCNDLERAPYLEVWRVEGLKRGYHSMAAFPLRVGVRIAGAMSFYAGEPYFFDDEKIQLLDRLAEDISFALEHIEQQEQLQKRVKELEEFYDMAVGRELKMVELKEEIEKLKEELEKYKKE